MVLEQLSKYFYILLYTFVYNYVNSTHDVLELLLQL